MLNRISTFYEAFAPSLPLQPWRHYLSGKNVALVAVAFLAGYKIYQAFCSLQGRVEKLEKELTSAREEIQKLKKQPDLSLRIIPLEQQLAALENIKESTETDDEAYQSAEDETTEPTPLDQLKNLFPGRDLQHSDKNFADFFLSTILRIGECTDCTLDNQGFFILSFAAARTITLTKLPAAEPNSLAWARKIIEGIISSISPQIQISDHVTMKIERAVAGTTMTFDPTSISLMPNAPSYTGHLVSLTVLSKPNDLGHVLRAQVEHNSQLLRSIKGGSLHFHKLIELVEINNISEK